MSVSVASWNLTSLGEANLKVQQVTADTMRDGILSKLACEFNSYESSLGSDS